MAILYADKTNNKGNGAMCKAKTRVSNKFKRES